MALPLTDTLKSEWMKRIRPAEDKNRKYKPWWDSNLENYAPGPDKSPKAWGGEVNTNRDFTLVHQKIPQLFYQSPEVSAKSSPLMQGDQAEALVQTTQDILNAKLGPAPDGVDAKRLIPRVLFDLVCVAGWGVTKMGYESTTVEVETDAPILDPTGQPMSDPMTGAPLTQKVKAPVPIHEDIFWKHVNYDDLLVPGDYESTDYDAAPWLAIKFRMPLRVAKRQFDIPEDFEPKPKQDAEEAPVIGESGDRASREVEGYEIWYRAALYDDDVRHPLRLRNLVILEGVERPVKHEDSPYQTLDVNTGRLTADSMVGYPIHVLTVRDLSKSAHIQSDCSISRPQVNELNRYRVQQIKQRDTNIPIRVYNTDVVPVETAEAIKSGDIGAMIGLPAEAFAQQRGPVEQIAPATYPRENMTFEDKQDNDIARTHAIDANQSGTQNNTVRTATELQIVQTATNVRLDHERSLVLDWFIKGCAKYCTLLQRFLTVEQAATYVGQQRAEVWINGVPDSTDPQTGQPVPGFPGIREIPVPLAFQAKPDSTIRTDAAQDKKAAMDDYQYFANDPYVNRQELLKAVLRKRGYTPEAIVVQPPPPEPEKPKISFAFKGEDVVGPQAPIVLELLAQTGIQISPEAIQQAQAAMGDLEAQMQQQAAQEQAAAAAQSGAGEEMAAADHQRQMEQQFMKGLVKVLPHGGKVAGVEPLSKHAVDQTGGMQGTGMAAPGGPGGM
jgi:hypothetical protein